MQRHWRRSAAGKRENCHGWWFLSCRPVGFFEDGQWKSPKKDGWLPCCRPLSLLKQPVQPQTIWMTMSKLYFEVVLFSNMFLLFSIPCLGRRWSNLTSTYFAKCVVQPPPWVCLLHTIDVQKNPPVWGVTKWMACGLSTESLAWTHGGLSQKLDIQQHYSTLSNDQLTLLLFSLYRVWKTIQLYWRLFRQYLNSGFLWTKQFLKEVLVWGDQLVLGEVFTVAILPWTC